jgi:hypothetical protein
MQLYAELFTNEDCDAIDNAAVRALHASIGRTHPTGSSSKFFMATNKADCRRWLED